MYIIKHDNMKVPAKIWSPEGSIESGALDQIINASALPFVFHHTCLMPDGHQGFGAPIGGVMATKGVVVPNFVGVDIGCGMCAVKTHLKVKEVQPILKQIMADIRHVIPLGRDWNDEPCDESKMPSYVSVKGYPVIETMYAKARHQLGSLGGGNHFIEIQKDAQDNVWIMIHSGSRNLGKTVADFYNKKAIELNAKWHTAVPVGAELAFLPLNTAEGKDYLAEMNYCVDFALNNRLEMMNRISNVFDKHFKTWASEPIINIAHNYASMEHHYGENVMVHRKGATRVRMGEIGIIPGSQGTKSYIVSGLGNPESFMSCSHGAGRKMSRSKACAELDLNTEILRLNDQGIVHSIRTHNDLDEASGAYKDISNVMASQTDLVTVVTELSPMGVIKG